MNSGYGTRKTGRGACIFESMKMIDINFIQHSVRIIKKLEFKLLGSILALQL